MSKVLFDASCQLSVVTVESQQLADCEILSEGNGASQGVVVLEGDKQVYLPNTSGDLKTTITNLSSMITSITGCFAALDALPTISGACASFTAQLLAIQTTLNTLKEQLK